MVTILKGKLKLSSDSRSSSGSTLDRAPVERDRQKILALCETEHRGARDARLACPRAGLPWQPRGSEVAQPTWCNVNSRIGGREMESASDHFTKLAVTQAANWRWAPGLNGLASVVLGVPILAWPGI